MSLFSRFFGGGSEKETPRKLVAKENLENAPCFGVLFAKPFSYTNEKLQSKLRNYHSSMSKAVFETDETLQKDQIIFGLAGWGDHVIKIIGFNFQMLKDVIEICVSRARYSPEIKEKAAQHTNHLLLYYAGYETNPLEQYVALAAVAGVLADFGAIVVINERNQISLPAELLSSQDASFDIIEALQELPTTMLYCGFLQYKMEGTENVWFRTLGGKFLGLPDLAALSENYQEASKYFDVFSNIHSYLLKTNAEILAGHTMQAGEDKFFAFREPNESEYFLDSDGKMLVLEITSADEIGLI